MDTYKSTNTLNGKFYMGSTTNFEERKKEHLRSKKNSLKSTREKITRSLGELNPKKVGRKGVRLYQGYP